MTDKTSSKTEDQMLEQTFGSLDASMTADNGSEPVANNAAASKSTKKPMSQNAIIGLAAVAATVVGGGYMFVLKPMLNPPQMVQNAAPIQPLQTAPQIQPAPVQVAQAEPVKPAPVELTPPAQVEPVKPAQVELTQTTQPLQAEPVKTDVVQPAPVEIKKETPTQQVAVSPAIVEPHKAVEGLDKTKGVKASNVDELKSLFDQQTQDLKSALNDIGQSVTVVKNHMEEQVKVNKDVDQRLTALENALKNGVKSIASKVSNITSTDGVTKQAPKKIVVRKMVTKSANTNTNANTSSDVILDKTLDQKSTIVSEEKIVNADLKNGKKEVALPAYNVHSIFSGRIWIKTDDGSLLTFQAGDTLPSGEKIEKVDAENFKVTTDKRKF